MERRKRAIPPLVIAKIRIVEMPALLRRSERISDLSIERVPIKIGRPAACISHTSWTTAAHLATSSPKTLSGSRLRIAGRFVGIGITLQR